MHALRQEFLLAAAVVGILHDELSGKFGHLALKFDVVCGPRGDEMTESKSFYRLTQGSISGESPRCLLVTSVDCEFEEIMAHITYESASLSHVGWTNILGYYAQCAVDPAMYT